MLNPKAMDMLFQDNTVCSSFHWFWSTSIPLMTSMLTYASTTTFCLLEYLIFYMFYVFFDSSLGVEIWICNNSIKKYVSIRARKLFVLNWTGTSGKLPCDIALKKWPIILHVMKPFWDKYGKDFMRWIQNALLYYVWGQYVWVVNIWSILFDYAHYFLKRETSEFYMINVTFSLQ